MARVTLARHHDQASTARPTGGDRMPHPDRLDSGPPTRAFATGEVATMVVEATCC
ncbi:hypothetical protein HX92_3026 [Mycobacterium tuberculosis]|nr:hypothetical protein HX92_3026 [Mycobacterium tuberculosis]